MRNPRKTITSFFLHLGLIGGSILTLIPLVWMILASVMPTGEASSEPPPFFPSHVTLEHYRELFVHLNIGRVLFNSAGLGLCLVHFHNLCFWTAEVTGASHGRCK